MRPFGLLSRRGVRPLLTAEIVSTTGSAMTALALPWLVLETTGSASKAGLVAAAEWLPMALLGIPSGQIAARLGPRRTMVGCDLSRAPLVALIPLLDALDALSFGILVPIAFALGAFFPAHFTSQRTILPELLGDDAAVVNRGNVLLQFANRLPLVLGPALAGSLIVLSGPSEVLVIDAVSYLIAAILVAFGVPRTGVDDQGSQGAGGLWDGVRCLAGDHLLGSLTVVYAALELAMQAVILSLPILAFTAFDERAGVAGLLLAAFGVGALLGTVPALRLARSEPVAVIRTAIYVQALPLWILAFDLPLAVLAMALLINGIANPVANAPTNTLITMTAPRAIRAKAMLAFITACTTAGGVGLLATGPVAEAFGARAVLAGAAMLATICALALTVSTRALRAPSPAPP